MKIVDVKVTFHLPISVQDYQKLMELIKGLDIQGWSNYSDWNILKTHIRTIVFTSLPETQLPLVQGTIYGYTHYMPSVEILRKLKPKSF